MTTNKPPIEEFLEAARWAPSADNSIPWHYKVVDDRSIIIRNDPQRSGRATDGKFTLTLLAIGAALENIALKASQLGWQTQTDLMEQDEQIEVQLHFASNQEVSPAPASDSSLADYIFERHTDRRFPFKGSLSDDEIKQITNALSDPTLCTFYTQAEQKNPVIRLIQQAEAIRFKDQVLHSELFDTVDFSQEQPDAGMSLSILAIEPPARPMFKLISKWSVMRALNKIGMSNLIAHRSVTLPMKLSPAIACIASTGSDAQAILNCGRDIQRFWLACTQLGLSVHPYAAPGVLSVASPDLDDALDLSLAEVRQKLMLLNDGPHLPIMFFRLGRKDGKPVRTGRRSLEDLAISVS